MLDLDYRKFPKAFTRLGRYKLIFSKVKKNSNSSLECRLKIELTQKNKFDLIKFQIEKLFLGINSANDNDLIILSDEDEIPNPKKIKEFNYKKYKFGIFMQNLYYYKLNFQIIHLLKLILIY